jgi:CRISPR-associated protein Cas6
MTIVELQFPVLGRELPEDNGYALYAAVSRTLDDHLPDDVAVASIGGPLLGDWKVRVTPETRLRIRAPAERIGELLPLAGKFLDVDGHEIRLGVPRVQALEAAPNLCARLVTIKGFTEPELFLGAVRRKLDELQVSGEAAIPPIPYGSRQGAPQRRIVTVKGRAIVGFALTVRGLTDAESLTLQERGLGGRRHMGCGIFSPLVEESMSRHAL